MVKSMRGTSKTSSCCTPGGTRTHTSFRTLELKSNGSTNSPTRAFHSFPPKAWIYVLRPPRLYKDLCGSRITTLMSDISGHCEHFLFEPITNMSMNYVCFTSHTYNIVKNSQKFNEKQKKIIKNLYIIIYHYNTH